MRLINLTVSQDEGLLGKKEFCFNFGHKTLIRSTQNSVGKSSLLRFLLFGLGFRIPSTSGLNMNKFLVSVKFSNSNGTFFLERNVDKIFLKTTDGNLVNAYNLRNETDFESLIQFIFDLPNPKVSASLLGCFYIDQESGWELWNRGHIHSKNKFSASDLIASFCEDELKQYNYKINQLRAELTKYNALFNLLQQTESFEDKVIKKNEALIPSDNEKLREQEDYLKTKRKELQEDLNTLSQVLADNNSLGEMLEKYSIVVSPPNGSPFVLKRQHVEPFTSNNVILVTQINDIKTRINQINNKLFKIQEQLNLSPIEVNINTVSQEAVMILRKSNIDAESLHRIIADLKTDIFNTKQSIQEVIKQNKSYYSTLYSYIKNRLNKKEIYSLEGKDLLRVDNNTFSGVELYDITLCYRLSYCDFLFEQFGIELPLIIDSPGNGERSIQNFDKMVNDILNERSQVIISTASNISSDNMKKVDMLIDSYGLIFEGKYKNIINKN